LHHELTRFALNIVLGASGFHNIELELSIWIIYLIVRAKMRGLQQSVSPFNEVIMNVINRLDNINAYSFQIRRDQSERQFAFTAGRSHAGN
jgi:hypothetical protein